MTAPLIQRLQLVVDATTGQSESRLSGLARAATDTGTAATRSAGQVAAAAQRVEDAQLRQKDAADAVRVAQLRLDEMRAKGTASGSQLAAAEARVESAQRKLHVATRQTAAAQAEQTSTQNEARESADDAAEASGGLSQEMDSLRGRIGGMIAGGALTAWLRNVTTGFTDGARAAGQQAVSMNATVEQAGRLGTLMGSVGVEAGDLLEIQAQFAGVVAADADALGDMGAAVQRNRDGTVNWALTLEDALVQLQGIPDATERNTRLFQLFGEEGGKQMAALLNSGVDLRDALEQIGTPFTEEDVTAAREYDATITRLSLAAGDFGRTVGRAVLPIVTGLAEGLDDVAGVVTGIPAPLGLAGAAALTMGLGMRSARTEGSLLHRTVGQVSSTWNTYRTNVTGAVQQTGLLRSAMGGARTAGSNLLSLAGGPAGVGMIAFGAGVGVASQAMADFQESSRDAAVELREAEDATDATAQSSEQLGRRLAEEAGIWEGLTASRRGATGAVDEAGGAVQFLDTVTGGALSSVLGLSDQMAGGQLAAAGYSEEIDRQREELGELAAQQEVSQQTTRTLTDLIAQGVTSGGEFTGAVRSAADAQAAEARTSGLAEAAIAAYNATTRDAVSAVRERIDAIYGAENAEFAFQEAMDAANAATDDGTTTVDEQRQAQVRLMEAALAAGDAAGDAAVEAAEASGRVLTDIDRANIRGTTMIENLRERLHTPGLAEPARAEIQGLIDQLTTAQERGDIQAILELTGADEVSGELDQTTEDRDAHVRVESRNGPAVISYIENSVAKDRRALVQLESRGGPAVIGYVQGQVARDRRALIRLESRGGPAVIGYVQGQVARDRRALIRLESRGGPAVISYVRDQVARDRLALIRVESRNGPAVDAYLDSLASNYGRGRTAVIDVQTRGGPAAASALRGPGAPGGGLLGGARFGAMVHVDQLVVQADASGRASAQSMAAAGRQVVQQLGAYTAQNGPGWLRGLNR